MVSSMRCIPETDVLHRASGDLVIEQERCDPGVMRTLCRRVVLGGPTHLDRAPISDDAVAHLGDRNAVRSSPTWSDVAGRSDRYADVHLFIVAPHHRIGRGGGQDDG